MENGALRAVEYDGGRFEDVSSVPVDGPRNDHIGAVAGDLLGAIPRDPRLRIERPATAH